MTINAINGAWYSHPSSWGSTSSVSISIVCCSYYHLTVLISRGFFINYSVVNQQGLNAQLSVLYVGGGAAVSMMGCGCTAHHFVELMWYKVYCPTDVEFGHNHCKSADINT